MIRHRQTGFTVIEVMLFLGVSALLTVGIFVGTGTAIAAQRYKDAVATFQSDVQQQYEDVLSVKNDRQGATSETGCTGERGKSNCVLLGKLMTITASGVVNEYRVYGTEQSSSTTDDHQLLRLYSPTIAQTGHRQAQLEWGTGISHPQGVSGNGVGILIVRSPRSGSVYTFTRGSTATNNLTNMIGSASAVRRTICVVPTGLTVAGTMAVDIAKDAASVNAVQLLSNEMLAQESIRC